MRPTRPSPPPERPRAGLWRRSKVAQAMLKGAGSVLSISITAPRPPRCFPSPPEPSASSRRRNRSGDCASVISTGIEPTPLGKAAVAIPSFAGRAPLPPLQLAPAKQERRLRFGDLHRDRADAAREGGGGKTVLRRRRAHAADPDRDHV